MDLSYTNTFFKMQGYTQTALVGDSVGMFFSDICFRDIDGQLVIFTRSFVLWLIHDEQGVICLMTQVCIRLVQIPVSIY